MKTRLFKYIEDFTTKNENFHMKHSGSFRISAYNIDCGYSLEPPRRGGSNEYPQSIFLSRKRKIMSTLLNPSFTIYNWGLRGSKLLRHVFVMFWHDIIFEKKCINNYLIFRKTSFNKKLCNTFFQYSNMKRNKPIED